MEWNKVQECRFRKRSGIFARKKDRGNFPVLDNRINFLRSLTWYRFYFPVSGKFLRSRSVFLPYHYCFLL